MALQRKPVKKRPVQPKKAAEAPSAPNNGVENKCLRCNTDLLPKEGVWTCPKCKYERSASWFGVDPHVRHITGEPVIIAVQAEGGMTHWALHWPEHNVMAEIPWDSALGSHTIPQEFGGNMRKLQFYIRSKNFRIVGGPNATD